MASYRGAIVARHSGLPQQEIMQAVKDSEAASGKSELVLAGQWPAFVRIDGVKVMQLIWAVALAYALLSFIRITLAALHGALDFDDAYMFYRYALHLRSGLGISWNPDGIPTYGLSSQAWLLVITVFSFLPGSPQYVLVLASALSTVVGLGLLTVTVAREAQSQHMRSLLAAGVAVCVPLLYSTMFLSNSITGMETMLSMAANAAHAWAVMRFLRLNSRKGALLCGCSGFFCIFVRPDNAICAFLVPVLAWLLGARRVERKHMAVLLGTTCLLVSCYLAACFVYFGSAVPLAAYLKAPHGYSGYVGVWNPILYLCMFFRMVGFYLFLLLLTFRRSDARLLIAYAVPVLVTFASLQWVNQIMGQNARYYLPFLPFVILPILWCADLPVESLQARLSPVRIGAGVAVLFLITPTVLTANAARYYSRVKRGPAVPVRQLVSRSNSSLPTRTWFLCITELSSKVVQRLPSGAVIAASEVGYIGAMSPGVTVIDEVGLNDTKIAKEGFSAADVLDRRPDFIWFPHNHYTGIRSALVSDPRLLSDYIVVRDAFQFGIAVRKNSKYEQQILADVRKLFSEMYPGQSIEDYVVLRTDEQKAAD